MVISKPTLPPRAGYVETVIAGQHVYKPIPQPTDSLEALVVDQEYRLILLELGLSATETEVTDDVV